MNDKTQATQEIDQVQSWSPQPWRCYLASVTWLTLEAPLLAFIHVAWFQNHSRLLVGVGMISCLAFFYYAIAAVKGLRDLVRFRIDDKGMTHSGDRRDQFIAWSEIEAIIYEDELPGSKLHVLLFEPLLEIIPFSLAGYSHKSQRQLLDAISTRARLKLDPSNTVRRCEAWSELSQLHGKTLKEMLAIKKARELEG